MKFIRICGLSRFIIIYWLENIHKKLTHIQQKNINDIKANMSRWCITTSGYFDKSINGNWKGDELHPNKIDDKLIIKTNDILKSNNFNRYIKELYDIIIKYAKINYKLSLLCYNSINENNVFKKELNLFNEYIHSLNKNKIEKYNFSTYFCTNSNQLFNLCNNKNILVINLFAELICSHYKSNKIIEWYTKYKNEYDNSQIIPNFKNIIGLNTEYSFGNGINIIDVNNFFEMLEIYKQKIDKISDNFDIAIVSCGAYTPFITDYIIDKHNKNVIGYGRFISNVFNIKYKYTNYYNDYIKENLEPYLCVIPDKYKIKYYNYIENGCYW